MRPYDSSVATCAVDDLWPDNRRVRQLAQRGNQTIETPFGHDGVAVEQQHQLALRAPYAFVVRRREADVRVERDDANSWPSGAHGIDAAVAGRVVDHDDLVRHVRRVLVQRLKAVLQIAPGVVADDHDGERVHAADSSAARVSAAARVHEYRASTPGAARSRRCAAVLVEQQPDQGRCGSCDVILGDVQRGVAADFARDFSVEQYRRHSGGERLERRMPKPFVFREQRERPCSSIQCAQLGVGHIRPNGYLRCNACRRGDRREILVRMRPIVADELEASVWMALRNRGESSDEIRDVTTIEDRADEQDERFACGAQDCRPVSRAMPGYTQRTRCSGRPKCERISRRADVGHRQHNLRVLAGPSRQPPPAQPFLPSEPLRMRGKGHVVDEYDDRGFQQQRRGVAGREEDIEAILRSPPLEARIAPTRCRANPEACVSPHSEAEE